MVNRDADFKNVSELMKEKQELLLSKSKNVYVIQYKRCDRNFNVIGDSITVKVQNIVDWVQKMGELNIEIEILSITDRTGKELYL